MKTLSAAGFARTDTRFVFKLDSYIKWKLRRRLEPTQDLYLNLEIFLCIIGAVILEPTQDLYLNTGAGKSLLIAQILEPTQDLYLNPHSL